MDVVALRCLVCDHRYEPQSVEYTCASCGVEGILEVELDYDAVQHALDRNRLAACPERSIWRYRPLLPLPPDAALPRLQVGWTPIYDVPALAKELGVGALCIKDDGRNPTGSYKDRASAVGAARALALGRREIACASTGNAASSLAGFAADLGMRAHIFVPDGAPEAKVAQLLVYGATVFLVKGGYEAAFGLCQQAVAQLGWYNRSCAVNPYLVEGKKTGGLEIAEQLRDRLPDVVAVPVGDGCIVSGIGKGLREMHRLGVIDRLPRLLGVQAEGACPIAQAFWSGREVMQPVQARTVADSIAVGVPRNWRKAVRTVRASGGAFVTVSDEQILAMLPRMAQRTGVFAEPTAVAALAGVLEARSRGLLEPTDSVLVLATGNGLKDVRGAMRAVQMPQPIEAELKEVQRVVAMAARS
jgi:threonine synthase